MSEGIFTIELGQYGFMLDTEWLYIALSWQMIIVSAVSIVAVKLWRGRK